MRGPQAAEQLPTRHSAAKGGKTHALTFPPSHSPHHSKWHPDRNPDSKEKAEKKFKEVSWFESGVCLGERPKQK